MKNLSLETWKSLELPMNLYFILNDLSQTKTNSLYYFNHLPQKFNNYY